MSGTEYDVIVLGAGPAGSLAARELARRGQRVLLVDRSIFPRPKVCGNCLDPRCLRIFRRTGLLKAFEQLPSFRLEDFTLSIDNQSPSHLRYPAGKEHYAVSRTLLDDWMRREAIESGAVFMGGVTVSHFEAPAALTIDSQVYQAKFLIGADGRNSWLARASGLASTKPSPCGRVGWQATLPASLARKGVHMSWFEEGYWGLAPYDSEHANLCMALGKGTLSTPQQILERQFPGIPALNWRSTTPLSRKRGRPATGRVLLAGDAARMVEPFTGEGIYLALASGVIAADVIDHHLKSNRADNAAGAYSHRHAALYRELSWQNGLLKILGKHPRMGKKFVARVKEHPEILQWIAGNFFAKSAA